MHAEGEHAGPAALAAAMRRVASMPFSSGMATSITTTMSGCELRRMLDGFGGHSGLADDLHVGLGPPGSS